MQVSAQYGVKSSVSGKDSLVVIFFIEGNWNRLIWKTCILGLLAISVLIHARVLFPHTSHLYLSSSPPFPSS